MGHGIVIGAGIAGLLSALALASKGWTVVILEKDTLVPHPSLRRGVPQSPHAHMLLKQGLEKIECMAPGFKTALIDAGGVSANMGRDWKTTLQAGTLARGSSQLDFISASRDLIESTLRSLVAQHPTIKIADNTRVMHIELSEHENSLVRWKSNNYQSESSPDLVIDASGRGSKILKWLHQAGFAAVPLSVTQTNLAYASCRFQGIKLAPGDIGWSCMYRAPDIPRGGVIMPVEQDEYIVTLSGLDNNDPPPDINGFLDFAGTLQCPDFREALESGTATSRIYTFKKPINYYRSFHRIARWPKTLVAIGDSVCSFNPVYGQGMTAATLAVERITDHINRADAFNAKKLQRHINDAYSIPWLIAKNEDQRWVSSPKRHERIAHYLMDKINIAGNHDLRVAEDFLSVLHMTQKPTRLLKARTLLKAVML